MLYDIRKGDINMKEYSYAVNKIRRIDGNVIVCNLLKYRVCNAFGNHPILTSLSKWKEVKITLTDAQMTRFSSFSDEDMRRAYLTKLLALS